MLSRIGFRMLVGLLDQAMLVPDPNKEWIVEPDLNQFGVVKDWLSDQQEWEMVEGVDWLLRDKFRRPHLNNEDSWELGQNFKQRLDNGEVFDPQWLHRTHTKPGALLAWVLVRYKALRDELLLLETVHEPD